MLPCDKLRNLSAEVSPDIAFHTFMTFLLARVPSHGSSFPDVQQKVTTPARAKEVSKIKIGLTLLETQHDPLGLSLNTLAPADLEAI